MQDTLNAKTQVCYLVCQSHGYLVDYEGTSKGYNWSPNIKVATRFPSELAARKACVTIGIEPDAAIAEMPGIAAAQSKRELEFSPTCVLKKMDEILSEHRLVQEYETDARDRWPERWEVLKQWILQCPHENDVP